MGEGEERLISLRALNVCGLLFNLGGVVLLFLFGMPFRIATGGKVITWTTDIVNEQIRRKDRLYTVLGWLGLGLIVVGTMLQVSATEPVGGFALSISIHWEALTAIGTLAVAVVAVWPILGGYRRRRILARNVRSRLLVQLRIFGLYIEMRTKGAIALLTALRPDEAREIVPLEEALRQDLLSAKEQDALAALVSGLKAIVIASPPDLAGWTRLLNELKRFHNELRRTVPDSRFQEWQ